MTEDIRLGDAWFLDDEYERHLAPGYARICLTEAIYTQLPTDIAETVERLLPGSIAAEVEKVERADSRTVEIVFDSDTYTYEGGGSSTLVPARYREDIEREVQRWFGQHWRIERKPFERQSYRGHPNRFYLRRVAGYRFRYGGESAEEARLVEEGTPAGLPDDAVTWDDVLDTPRLPGGLSVLKRHWVNIWTADVGTGTVHLVPADRSLSKFGLEPPFDDPVTEPVGACCGYGVAPEAVAQGALTPYWKVVQDHATERLGDDVPYDRLEDMSKHGMTGWFEGELDPQSLFGDDLCQSCWRAYARDDSHTDVLVQPDVDYWRLLTVDGVPLTP